MIMFSCLSEILSWGLNEKRSLGSMNEYLISVCEK